jgi:hypothetical protein
MKSIGMFDVLAFHKFCLICILNIEDIVVFANEKLTTTESIIEGHTSILYSKPKVCVHIVTTISSDW